MLVTRIFDLRDVSATNVSLSIGFGATPVSAILPGDVFLIYAHAKSEKINQ